MKLMNTMKVLLLFCLVMVGFGVMLVGCDSTDEEVPVGVENQVLIKDFKFLPQDITVTVGTTVTWVNKDSVIHTVEGSGMDSGNLSKGDEFTFTFDEVGVFDYICGPHPYMTGSVIVE
ncbi:MAG: blue (type 1) copper domain protein [Fusobacteria bacterium]|nr:MAG: blue (type 1) copper domain protein [Fusobacteriota bacterium]KAF0230218.1 MAG: blue (type 1) copper domain [Fusobacteriota bacterium]